MAVKKTAGIVGIIVAIVLLILAFSSTTPDKYIKSYGENKMYEYVGGDAYNYIIEASLRGGEIAGAKAVKAIYIAASGILFILSLSFLTSDGGRDEIHSDIGEVKKEIKDAQKAITQINESLSAQQKEILSSLKMIINIQKEFLQINDEDKGEVSD